MARRTLSRRDHIHSEICLANDESLKWSGNKWSTRPTITIKKVQAWGQRTPPGACDAWHTYSKEQNLIRSIYARAAIRDIESCRKIFERVIGGDWADTKYEISKRVISINEELL